MRKEFKKKGKMRALGLKKEEITAKKKKKKGGG